MKIILATSLLILISLLTVKEAVYIALFQANQNYIAENFCENKSILEEISERTCQGKCYVQKIIVKNTNQDTNSHFVPTLDWEKTNKSLANAVTGRDQLQKRLESTILELKGDPDAIVLVTDLEALHPYLRIGAIEAQLQGKFHIPTIFFYPGVRTGKTRLRFLGFYPEDGNYRSVHVGG